MSAHAMLSASGAKRWMACTPSAVLEAQCPQTSSAYADEGTLAHTLGELLLRKRFTVMKPSAHKAALDKIKADPLYNPEMLVHATNYADYVENALIEARKTCADARLYLERRLDFSDYVPDGFGTGDAIIIADGWMDVIDLKYGKGVPVDAVDNPQTRLYGIGAVREFEALYDIESVRMTIYQPRLDSISSEELTVTELLGWAERDVVPKAALAAQGEGEFVPGDHCRFCRAKALCPARAGTMTAVEDFAVAPPTLLALDEIGDLLPKIKIFKAWAEDVEKYALHLAITEGYKIPGYKIVEGRANRCYADEAAVAKKLHAGGLTDVDVYTKKIIGLTALEKIWTKKQVETVLGSLIIKPAGKPTLVPANDKRPELQTLIAAQDDFADDVQDD